VIPLRHNDGNIFLRWQQVTGSSDAVSAAGTWSFPRGDKDDIFSVDEREKSLHFCRRKVIILHLEQKKDVRSVVCSTVQHVRQSA
jgi:hypothetical protein